MDKEMWKDIKGYKGLYQVSNLGKVKALARERNNQYSNKEIILKQSEDGKGYLQVILNKNGERKSFKVHRLVAETFIDKSNFKRVMLNNAPGALVKHNKNRNKT